MNMECLKKPAVIVFLSVVLIIAMIVIPVIVDLVNVEMAQLSDAADAEVDAAFLKEQREFLFDQRPLQAAQASVENTRAELEADKATLRYKIWYGQDKLENAELHTIRLRSDWDLVESLNESDFLRQYHALIAQELGEPLPDNPSKPWLNSDELIRVHELLGCDYLDAESWNQVEVDQRKQELFRELMEHESTYKECLELKSDCEAAIKIKDMELLELEKEEKHYALIENYTTAKQWTQELFEHWASDDDHPGKSLYEIHFGPEKTEQIEQLLGVDFNDPSSFNEVDVNQQIQGHYQALQAHEVDNNMEDRWDPKDPTKLFEGVEREVRGPQTPFRIVKAEDPIVEGHGQLGTNIFMGVSVSTASLIGLVSYAKDREQSHWVNKAVMLLMFCIVVASLVLGFMPREDQNMFFVNYMQYIMYAMFGTMLALTVAPPITNFFVAKCCQRKHDDSNNEEGSSGHGEITMDNQPGETTNQPFDIKNEEGSSSHDPKSYKRENSETTMPVDYARYNDSFSTSSERSDSESSRSSSDSGLPANLNNYSNEYVENYMTDFPTVTQRSTIPTKHGDAIVCNPRLRRRLLSAATSA